MLRTPTHPRLHAVCIFALGAWLGVAALPALGAERGLVRKAPSAPAAETEARVIVKYKSDSTMMRALAAKGGAAAAPQHAQALGSRLGMSLRDGRGLGQRSQLMFARGVGSAALAARLAAEPEVEYAVVDGRQRALAAPNDPRYGPGQTVTPVVGQWYLRAPDAVTVSSINAEAAWDLTQGSASVVVAVLDTGVRPEHPDLQGKLLAGYDFIGGDARGTANESFGTAIDGDGRDADPSDPGDGVTQADINNNVPGCSAADIGPSSWHGTQTAGLVGASTNNGVGMASIGRNVMVLPLRVLGKCGGYDSDIQDAMRWAAGIDVAGVPTNTRPAKVINLSLGSTSNCSAAYQDVINQVIARGVVVVAAAGNDGVAVGAPASCTGVIAVAGVRHTGTKVGYSDLGPQVTLSAPAGNCVNAAGGTCLYPLLTTTNSGLIGPGASTYSDGDNDVSLGTSFSAPLVSGTVGLMFSANPSLTPEQVRTVLTQTARAFPTTGADAGVLACTAPSSTAQNTECYCTTSTCGAGMLDAGAALSASALSANIVPSSTRVAVGTPVTLDGSTSQAFGGATIVSYAWAITSGQNIAGLSSTNAATTTLTTTGTGTVTVSLTVTDSAGRQSISSTSITVTPVAPPPASDGGGGGGAVDAWWLAGVLAAALALSSRRFLTSTRRIRRLARRASAR